MNNYQFFPTLLQKHLADQQGNISWLMQPLSLHPKKISQLPPNTIDNRGVFPTSCGYRPSHQHLSQGEGEVLVQSYQNRRFWVVKSPAIPCARKGAKLGERD